VAEPVEATVGGKDFLREKKMNLKRFPSFRGVAFRELGMTGCKKKQREIKKINTRLEVNLFAFFAHLI
jgi:hypothetical protein